MEEDATLRFNVPLVLAWIGAVAAGAAVFILAATGGLDFG